MQMTQKPGEEPQEDKEKRKKGKVLGVGAPRDPRERIIVRALR